MNRNSSLEDILKRVTADTLVLGVGNDIKGDDGIGPWIASQLEGVCNAIDGTTVPEAFLPEIREIRPDMVLIVDAAKMDSKPGSIGVFRGKDVANIMFSTHTLPLSMLARYIEKEIGPPAYIIGIEPRSFGFGDRMSDEVADAGKTLVDLISHSAGERHG